MLTNETRRNILDRVKASGYPGGVSEAFRAAEQGIDVVDQFVQQQQLEQQQQAEQAQVQGQGQQMAEGNQSPPPPPPQNTPDGRVSQPNINNPIDNNQGHLVQSQNTQNVGIQSLPTGSAEGTIIESPAAYQKGGVKKEVLESAEDEILNPHKQGILFTDESAIDGTHRIKDFINQKSRKAGQYYEAYVRDNPHAKDALDRERRSRVPSLGFLKKVPLAAAMLSPIEAGRGSTIIDQETGINKYTGKKEFTPFQKGGVRKYPHGGFHFNPADFDPNYDQGSVSDNTQINNFQEDQSNFVEKESTLAKIEADRKYTETQAQIKAQKGTLVNTTKKNAGIALSNSFLANQLNGGYGGSNMRKSLEANPEKTEEIFKNTMRSSGMNTMRDVALGTASLGAGAQITNAGRSNLVQRIMAYPGSSTSSQLQNVITSPTIKSSIAPALKGLYNYGYVTGLPNVIGGVLGAGIDYASGKSSGLDSSLKVSKNLVNFVPALKGFNKVKPLVKNFKKVKETGKAVYDIYKGNYSNAALRLGSLHPSLNTGGKYAIKHLRRFMPKTDKFQNLPIKLLNSPLQASPSVPSNSTITRNYLGDGTSSKSLLRYGGYERKFL